MKMNKFLVTAVLLVGALAATAQEEVSVTSINVENVTPAPCPVKNFPKKGDVTLAATIGYNNYASVSAQPGNLASYSATAPNTNWFEKNLSMGVEGGWFFKELWKLDFGGGLNFLYQPSSADMPGTVDPSQGTLTEDDLGEIPGYNAVPKSFTWSYNLFVGFDRYFKLRNAPNLALYTGLRLGYSYACNKQSDNSTEITWNGVSQAETWNLRSSVTFGAEYYFLPNMFAGVSIDAFTYIFSYVTYVPQEGLGRLDAYGNNWSVLANPTLKIGFKF